MAKRVGKPDYEKVEQGIQRISRHYDDGSTVISHKIFCAGPNGKMVYRTLRCSRTQARKELDLMRAEIHKGDYLVITKSDSRTTFKDVADHWLTHSTHLKRSTQQSHSRIINGTRLASLHDVTMRGLTYERLQEFQADIAHLAPATQRQLTWIVKAICDDAVNRGLLRSNPCDKLKRPKVGRSRVTMPTKEQVRGLLDRLSSPTRPEGAADCWNVRQSKLERQAGRPEHVDPRWRLIVETAAFTGLRAGELVGLKVADLDHTRRSLTVARSIPTNGLREDTPKTHAGQRTVGDLRPNLCDRLADLSLGRKPGEYLFGWTDGEGVSRPYRHMNFYRRIYRPACDELGIGGRFHDLRHFHASLLIERGLDPVRVAARLGHEKPSFTLDVYSHLFHTETTGLGAALDAEWSDQPTVVPITLTTKKPF